MVEPEMGAPGIEPGKGLSCPKTPMPTVWYEKLPYLSFVDVTPEGRKTRIIEVTATRDEALLGVLKWFGRWRQYAFFPVPASVFNPTCLDAITALCRRLTVEHHERRALR